MKSLLLSLPLFLCSCSFYSSSEVGYISPRFGLRNVLRPDTRPISAVKTSTRIGLTPHPALSIEVGPTIIRGGGEIYGMEAALKIRYPAKISPYMIAMTGVGTSRGWHGSDASYTFTTEFGAGVSLRATPHVAISLDYRIFHHSNGRSFFGDSTRHFLGLSKATKNSGYENGGIFLGIQYDF